jgi:hypothetical protein
MSKIEQAPEAKANQLIETFYNVWAFNNTFLNFSNAQKKKTKAYKMAVKSAGICTEEIIDHIQYRVNLLHDAIDMSDLKFWQSVKEAIRKI